MSFQAVNERDQDETFEPIGAVGNRLVRDLLEKMICRRLFELSHLPEHDRVIAAVDGLDGEYQAAAIEIIRDRGWVSSTTADAVLDILRLREGSYDRIF